MSPNTRSKRGLIRPYLLDQRGENILRAVHRYRYMTAIDVCYLFYSPRSLTRVRNVLSLLCGGGDYTRNQYLYRFCLPSVTAGNPQRVYVLGRAGREFLESEGLSVNWYFRPEKAKQLSFSQIMHNLLLTRFLIALAAWAKGTPDASLLDVKTGYELQALGSMKTGGGLNEKTVVPDGWVRLETKVKGRARPGSFSALIEIDRGTMYKERFKKHILSRVEFVRSGEYTRIFNQKAVMIAYASSGTAGEASEGRRKALTAWTKEALSDVGMDNWGGLFRIASVAYKEMYTSALFDRALWYRPYEEKPVKLFEG